VCTHHCETAKSGKKQQQKAAAKSSSKKQQKVQVQVQQLEPKWLR
jgi:hypothetical protein